MEKLPPEIFDSFHGGDSEKIFLEIGRDIFVIPELPSVLQRVFGRNFRCKFYFWNGLLFRLLYGYLLLQKDRNKKRMTNKTMISYLHQTFCDE